MPVDPLKLLRLHYTAGARIQEVCPDSFNQDQETGSPFISFQINSVQSLTYGPTLYPILVFDDNHD